MSTRSSAYVLCGTPRSGSTLLCEMLSATGVAGRPNSFFRRQDIEEWAQAWGVPCPDGVDDPTFNRAYLAAMRQAGAADTGVFGLRLMWDSLGEAADRLASAFGESSDITVNLQAWLGPTTCIHVTRLDKVAQAVSLVRAEQSGLWHLAADGSVLEGLAVPEPAVYDSPRIARTLRELLEADQAWNAFFVNRGITPAKLVYEEVTADPRAAVRAVLVAIGGEPELATTVEVATQKMARSESLEWIERFRSEHGHTSNVPT